MTVGLSDRMVFLLSELQRATHPQQTVAFSIIQPEFKDRIGLNGKKELVIDSYWLKCVNHHLNTVGYEVWDRGFDEKRLELYLRRIGGVV